MIFFPLDYSSPPSDGFYWVAGTRPVADPDDCCDGVVRNGYTGETEKFVALVWLSVGEDNCIDYHPVDRDNMGTVHEEDSVTHYAPFQNPAHPSSMSTRDTLWFATPEQADRFAQALAAAGHESERIQDDDFSLDSGWRSGVVYSAPVVTEFSQTTYSPAGRKASRFQGENH